MARNPSRSPGGLSSSDWLNDDYTMKIVGDRLCDKTLDDVIELSRDKQSVPVIPSMTGDKVSTNYRVFTNQRRLFLSLTRYYKMSQNRLTRLIILHGYSIYMDEIGIDLESLYDTLQQLIFANDDSTFNRLSSINCNIPMSCLASDVDNTSSVTLTDDESAMLGSGDTACCMPKIKFVTFLIMLSLRTHPDLKNFDRVFNPDIKLVFERQREKIEKFKDI